MEGRELAIESSGERARQVGRNSKMQRPRGGRKASVSKTTRTGGRQSIHDEGGGAFSG